MLFSWLGKTTATRCFGWFRIFKFFLFLRNKPTGYVYYLNSLILTLFVFCSGYQDFGKSIADSQKRRHFSVECFFTWDVVWNLNVGFGAVFYYNKSLFPYHIAYQHIPHSLASVAQLQQGFHKGDHNQAFLFPERQIWRTNLQDNTLNRFQDTFSFDVIAVDRVEHECFT